MRANTFGRIHTLLLALLLALTALAQPHPWAGKRIGYIGDSITDPNTFRGSVTKYWEFLSRWLEGEAYVYAVSGFEWSHAPGLADGLYKDHGQDVDAIVVFLGTNDFNSSVPLGEWYTYQKVETQCGRREAVHAEALVQRSLIYADSTFRGRINTTLLKLKTLWPTKQIVLLTPIHRAHFSNQPDESFPNHLGLYIDDYVRCIREAGNVWSVPIIDLNALSGLNPMVEQQAQYFRDDAHDRLHPNTQGHERIAKTLLQQFLTLPIF